MKKTTLSFLTAMLIVTVLMGCSAVEPAVPDNTGLVRTPEPSTYITAEPPSVTSTPDYSSDDIAQKEYVQDESIASDTAEVKGISYTILDAQYTKEFGSRNAENLTQLSIAEMDDQHTILDGHSYLFLTIQFTNISEESVEFSRNREIYAISADAEMLQFGIESVYCDEYWAGGTPSEGFHWVLPPGESVTSEIGWLINDWSEFFSEDEARIGRDWSLYYDVTGVTADDEYVEKYISLGLGEE